MPSTRDCPISAAVLHQKRQRRMHNTRRSNGPAITTATASTTSTTAAPAQSPIHARAPSTATVCMRVLAIFLLLLMNTSRPAVASTPAATNDNGDDVAGQQKTSPIQPQHVSPLLAGIRIEPEKPGEPGFIGYNEDGVSIVAPQTPVHVVLFGCFLDDIALIGFTTNNKSCSEALAKIHQKDFIINTAHRVAFIHKFEESESIYKICLKQKANGDDPPIHVVDYPNCSVSTNMPPRKYYFPFGVQISILVGLLVLSGLFSGLNLGLMSLTLQELTLISNSGSSTERRYAQAILPVRKSGNRLLCSLLIGNVCVNSAISILFDDLTSGFVALAVSSVGIVIFGEIFPQALCVKKGLAVGAHTIWLTRFFMVLTSPLAYPISWMLDCVLGDEVVSYDRKRLMELIKLSTKNASGTPAEELKIAIGALEMGDKTVKDVMTKIDDVFMLSQETDLNSKVVAEILRSGYTRIPVYAKTRDNVVSLLFVKDLALLDPDDNFAVKTFCDYYRHPVRRVPENTPLRSMLEEFKKGDYHMALVDRQEESPEEEEARNELVGLVTLEDIVEEILQAEIVDETDVVTDNVHRRRRRKSNHRRDLTLFIDDAGSCQISLQMQLVTIQFLEGNFPAFKPSRIAQNIFEKVIRANVHKVEVSHLTDLNDPKTVLPKKAKLYTKKFVADKFVLILEGRALVTIGQEDMTFEVGPWQCFGTELLNQLDQLIDTTEREQTSIGKLLAELVKAAKKIQFVPDYSVKILSECTYLEISVATYMDMYRSTLITRDKCGPANGTATDTNGASGDGGAEAN